MTYGGGKFVAADRYGYVFVSENGENWTRINTGVPFGGSVYAEYIDGLFFLTGHDQIKVSNDGYNWTNMIVPDLAILPYLKNVIKFNNEYHLYARNTAYKSSDGYNWTKYDYDRSGSSTGEVATNGEIMVRVDFGGSIRTSTNGIDWNEVHNHGETLWSIQWTGEEFIAVGDGVNILKSTDGINWTSETSPENIRLENSVITDDKMIVVGSGGSIYTQSVVQEPKTINIHAGYQASNEIGIQGLNSTLSQLGLDSDDNIEMIDHAIEKVLGFQQTYGSLQNRMEVKLHNITTEITQTEVSRSK